VCVCANVQGTGRGYDERSEGAAATHRQVRVARVPGSHDHAEALPRPHLRGGVRFGGGAWGKEGAAGCTHLESGAARDAAAAGGGGAGSSSPLVRLWPVAAGPFLSHRPKRPAEGAHVNRRAFMCMGHRGRLPCCKCAPAVRSNEDASESNRPLPPTPDPHPHPSTKGAHLHDGYDDDLRVEPRGRAGPRGTLTIRLAPPHPLCQLQLLRQQFTERICCRTARQ